MCRVLRDGSDPIDFKCLDCAWPRTFSLPRAKSMSFDIEVNPCHSRKHAKLLSFCGANGLGLFYEAQQMWPLYHSTSGCSRVISISCRRLSVQYLQVPLSAPLNETKGSHNQ